MTNHQITADHYSEEGFWAKLARCAKAAGREVVERALQLYYAMQASETPLWARGVIASALAYFISPIDAIPDVIPVIGYSDDLAVLGAALVTVAAFITADIKAKADATVRRWFD